MTTSEVASICALCNKSAPLKCDGCDSVFYCGIKHQQEDWSRHENQCRAYEIKTSPGLGRHLVASRDIKKGQVIIRREEPLALGPRHIGPLPDICPGCFKSLACQEVAENCPGCEWPVCSRICSGLTNPDRHGRECNFFKIFRRGTNSCPPEVILPLRCLLLQTSDPAKWQDLAELAKEAAAKHINSPPDPDLAEMEGDIVNLSNEYSNFIPDCSQETVRNVMALLSVSGREFYAPGHYPLFGVYPSYCRLTHSCLPNLRLNFDLPPENKDPGNNGWKGCLTIVARRNIAKDEPLTYSFVNTLLPTMTRQRELGETRNFQCSCERCLDPHELGLNTGTIKCLDCVGFIVPTNPANIDVCDWACDIGCGKTLTREKILMLENTLTFEVAAARYGQPGEPSTEDLESLVQALEQILHPNHHLRFIVRNLLAKLYGSADEGDLDQLTVEQLAQKSDLCRESRLILGSPHVPDGSTNVAEMLIEQHRADFELLKRNFSSKIWDGERCVQALVECRKLLQGVAQVLINEFWCPQRAKFKEEAERLKFVLLSWAAAKGLKLPDVEITA